MSDFTSLVGDTLQFSCSVHEDSPTKAPLDLTGCSVLFRARSGPTEDDESISLTVGDGITIVDGPEGMCLVHLSPANTSILGDNGGPLTYILRVTTEDEDVFTVASGKITLKKVP